MSREQGVYVCFACDFRGNALRIIRLAEERENGRCDFHCAQRKYAEIVGREVPRISEPTSKFSGGGMAAEERSYEGDSGLFRFRLRRNPSKE